MDIQKGTYTESDGQKNHVPIERASLFSQLQRGDHIAIKGKHAIYWHHAIVEDIETEQGYSNSTKGSSRANRSRRRIQGKQK